MKNFINYMIDRRLFIYLRICLVFCENSLKYIYVNRTICVTVIPVQNTITKKHTERHDEQQTVR